MILLTKKWLICKKRLKIRKGVNRKFSSFLYSKVRDMLLQYKTICKKKESRKHGILL